MGQTDDRVVMGPPDANASVIWLHGLGADGNDFAPIVPELGLPDVRFIFPHAPQRPITINGGMVMRGWYDIASMDIGSDDAEDARGIRESQAIVEQIIAEEISRGVDTRRIVLAGFSQGGAIALHTALRYDRPLAGLMALSTYLPLAATLDTERNEANLELPIFMAHGAYDPVIAITHAHASRDRLKALGYTIQWGEYMMPHAVNPEELGDIRTWLHARLS
ncbi:MAG: alpha/beta hydrolase [Gammaproteobacteria bacterium]